MSGFFSPPTFNPPVYPIALGTAGQVLTMVGGKPAFANATGGGGKLGTFLAYASPAGTLNDVAPPSFASTVGILNVTLPNGPATWTGLEGGGNLQLLLVANADTVNALTLAALNGGSAAANQFRYVGDLFIPPLSSVLIAYTATAPAQWIVTA